MLALAKPIHTRAVKEALILADMLAKTPVAAIVSRTQIVRPSHHFPIPNDTSLLKCRTVASY